MSPPKLLELRPDRIHLDPNFNGYKLSLEKVPVVQETLDVTVDRVLPSKDQYSFLHAKLFGIHNHILTGEIASDSGSVYFVDKNWQVQKAYLDQYSNTFTLIQVWEVPRRERKEGDYNFSLKFISENLGVLSDGTGMLYVLDTGTRSNDDKWLCVFCDEVLSPEKQFIIQDVVRIEAKLHCLLFSVEHDDATKKHSAVLHWITLQQAEDNSWGSVALRELKCKGEVYYAYLEPVCNAVYCVSDAGFKYTVDSENPIKSEPRPGNSEKYEWTQTGEDIVVKFKLPENFIKDDICVNGQTESEISVKYGNDCMLEGRLLHAVDQGATTWTTTSNCLELILVKKEPGVSWTKLMREDDAGTLDSSALEEVHQRLSRFTSDTEATRMECEQGATFGSQQIEECDFEDDKLIVFERLCCNTHEVTHRANLGSHQVLLTTYLSPNLAPAMAVKNDVDACLWQPQQMGENFSLKHEATLLAFAYVQASKQQKKFSACAPDLNYSVICEFNRHIFLYRQNKPMGNAELRNRTTGRRFGTIAEQQVVSISSEEILGLYAANTVLFLLTENSIVALQL